MPRLGRLEHVTVCAQTSLRGEGYHDILCVIELLCPSFAFLLFADGDIDVLLTPHTSARSDLPRRWKTYFLRGVVMAFFGHMANL